MLKLTNITGLAVILLYTAKVCFAQSEQSNLSAATASDRIEQALTAVPGDAVRGRAIVTNRQIGLCLLCHTGSFSEELTPGNVAPSLHGLGARYSTAQLRLRVAAIRQIYPNSLMPNMHVVPLAASEQKTSDHQARIANRYLGQPILTAQQVEDVVAFLKILQ